MDILSELSTLGLFGTGLSQHARLVTLASAQERALPQTLMVERVKGREAVNELFVFEVDALSVSTDLDLGIFLGEELTVGLLQPDGSRRRWHGLCTHAAWHGADGGVARYRLRLDPALSLLTHRRDSYIFQDKNVQEIVTELLADYPPMRFDFDITQTLALRPGLTQYCETDFDFLTRILASEGLNWRFKHDQSGDQAAREGDGHAKHRMVIFDSQTMAPATPNDDKIRFHGVRATERGDAIDEFRARRHVQANAVSMSSWDPRQLVAPSAEQQSHLDAGDVPELAIYDGSVESIASQRDVADSHSGLMLKALELDNKVFDGAGAVRRLAAGHAFDLTQHEQFGAGKTRFKVLWVEHEARNNFASQIKGATHAFETGTYRNRFGCVRNVVPIVPRPITAPHASTALGPETAMIVGLPNAVNYACAWQPAPHLPMLNLGFLIAQSPLSTQRGSYRGSGFELRTDAWGVVRGGEGVLLSTSARAQQGSGVTSTQMDVAEALALMRGGKELAGNLNESAATQKALFSKAALGAFTSFITHLDPEQQGKHEGVVNGHDAFKTASGTRKLDQAAPVEKFGAPVVLMESAASINWATPASTAIYAGQQLQWTTQSGLHVSAGHTVSAVAANAAGFYSHSGGIQAIAGNGPVSLQAHTDQLEILAHQTITVVSVNDTIKIKAKEKIVLQAGESSITLNGGDITFACPGNFAVKGGEHPFTGGSEASPQMTRLPDSTLKGFDEAFILKSKATGTIMANVEYRVRFSDGSYVYRKTNENSGQYDL